MGESPLVVAAGFIGKLKIEIPLTRIQSRAWVVHIDQVYLVAVPSQLTEVRTSCAVNICIEDTIGTQLAVLYTVEPLYRGHHWDPAGCPVYSGTSLERTSLEPVYRGHPCYPSLLLPLSPVLPPHPLYVLSPSTMKRRKKQGCRNRNRGNWPSLRSSGG